MKKVKLVCKHCKKENEISINKINGYVNWKCSKCYSINPLRGCPAVKWNCDTGTVKRNKK